MGYLRNPSLLRAIRKKRIFSFIILVRISALKNGVCVKTPVKAGNTSIQTSDKKEKPVSGPNRYSDQICTKKMIFCSYLTH